MRLPAGGLGRISDLLHRLIQHRGPVRAVALKGNEAAGFVSGDTIGILYSSAKETMLRSSGREMEMVIWGGVATPEAAAAFLATGLRG